MRMLTVRQLKQKNVNDKKSQYLFWAVDLTRHEKNGFQCVICWRIYKYEYDC